MSQTRTGTDNAVKNPMPLLKGSTKKILTGLYLNMLAIKDFPAEDPNKFAVLERSVKLDMETAAAGRKLHTAPERLSKTNEAIVVSIGAIKSNASTSKLAGTFESSHNGFIPKITELNNERTQLKTDYEALVSTLHQTVGELLKQVANGTKSIKTALEELEKLDTQRTKLAVKVDIHLENYAKVQKDMDSLHRDVYLAVPDKSKLPSPATEAEAKKLSH